MHIELISKLPVSQQKNHNLLFIHGAFHGAWCWDEYFLDWFSARGWSAHALSLRGHGLSDGADTIKRWSLSDYADDIRGVIVDLEGPITLIGHSMGGVLAQMCWTESSKIAGLAMVASSPLRPAASVVLQLLRRKPVSLLLGQLLRNPKLMRNAMEPFFFSDNIPKAKQATFRSKLSLDSPRALKSIFSRSAPTLSANETRPVLLLAGRDDWSIPPAAHKEIADLYNVPVTNVPGGHDLMLDDEWEATAHAIEDWLLLSSPT